MRLSQYLSRQTMEMHLCAKQVLGYSKGAMDHELCFQELDENLKIVGFVDAG